MYNPNLRCNLRAFRAAASLIFFTIALTLPTRSYSQEVFPVNSRFSADVSVFVTQYRSQADLIVYESQYKYQASGNNGIWFTSNSAFSSDKKIYFTEYRFGADIVVYFTRYRSQAGWKNLRKRYLFN